MENLTRSEMARLFRLMADDLERRTTGVLIPIYVRPGPEWERVAAAKAPRPRVPLLAIVNPNNGPGASKRESYAAAIPKLSGAGVQALGYVWTNYGGRPLSEAQTDIGRWREWYPEISGVFVDEMASKTEQLAYYQAVQKAVRYRGMTVVVGNPGTAPQRDMFGAADALVVSERAEALAVESLQKISADGGSGKIAVLVHGAPRSVVENWLPSAKSLLSYVYITDDKLPNPWNTVSSHLEATVEVLDR